MENKNYFVSPFFPSYLSVICTQIKLLSMYILGNLNYKLVFKTETFA